MEEGNPKVNRSTVKSYSNGRKISKGLLKFHLKPKKVEKVTIRDLVQASREELKKDA